MISTRRCCGGHNVPADPAIGGGAYLGRCADAAITGWPDAKAVTTRAAAAIGEGLDDGSTTEGLHSIEYGGRVGGRNSGSAE